MSLVRFPLTATEKLNFQALPDWLTQLSHRLIQENFQVYLVGGAVRDLLWGEQPKDWDLATDALPEQLESLFSKTISTGKQFGTVIVIQDGHTVEVTTLREDLTYNDGRHPEAVRFGKDIQLDLARRDFTINAIAFDFSTKELVDPFKGYRDVQRRLLRSVGDPNLRFQEDGLRMFRYYRFLATLNLQPNQLTKRAINPDWTNGVSLERIRDELNKLLLGKWVRKGLIGLKRSGLLEKFLPELANTEKIKQGIYHRWDLWAHILMTIENIKPQLHLRLAALLHDIAKPLTRFEDQEGVHFYGHEKSGAEIGQQIMERLRYPKKIINMVIPLIRWHMFSINTQTSDGGIRRLIMKVGPDRIPDLLELRRADIVATGRVDYQTWEIWQYISQRILNLLNEEFSSLNHPLLKINGDDLIEYFQLTPGPLIGELLSYLKERILDEPTLNQRNCLLELAEVYLQTDQVIR